MMMNRMIVPTLVFWLASAGIAWAGHTNFVAIFKGTLSTDADDDGRAEKTKLTEKDFLDDDNNLLVVIFDTREVGLMFNLEEWTDPDQDGIPDTMVRLIMHEEGMTTIDRVPGSGRFNVALVPDDLDLDGDGVIDLDGGMNCTGKSKVDDNEKPTKWSCKLVGVANGGGIDNGSFVKGVLKSVRRF